jgi:putative FmdB family regulatory protein
MATYNYKCQKCKDITEEFLTFSEHEVIFKKACKKCKGDLEQVILEAPNFTIPGNCTFDGIAKVSGTDRQKRTKEELAIPVQVENADGSITKMGKKSDIEND